MIAVAIIGLEVLVGDSNISPKGYIVSCRFHVRLIVFLFVYLFVCHVALRSP